MSNKRHNDDEFIRSKLDILFSESSENAVSEVPETLLKRMTELAEKLGEQRQLGRENTKKRKPIS